MSATITNCRACGALMRQHPAGDAYLCLGCGALVTDVTPTVTGPLVWRPFAEKMRGKP